ncbi:FIST N-terminal domain-containing protein [Actinoplanes ianthinogenes]|uniref:FIST N-terminal domain-containing protein n=1 Tax=Actinoplanes ianthinogenes TaxID=122358 RepID=UPI001E5D53E6|nr:FIST N-terminal domain-containing protein [Actinoplanes ianthinogenes]
MFCSTGYQVPELFDALPAQVPAATVIVGCTTSGQLADGGVDRVGVAMAAWGGDGFDVRTEVSRTASTRVREAGADAAAALAGLEGEHQALLLIGDGLTGNQHEFVGGAFSVAGASVPLVGGCAGSDYSTAAARGTCQVPWPEDRRP